MPTVHHLFHLQHRRLLPESMWSGYISLRSRCYGQTQEVSGGSQAACSAYKVITDGMERLMATIIRRTTAVLASVVMLAGLTACTGETANDDASSANEATYGSGGQTIKIASGSENKEAADVIKSAAEKAGVTVKMDWMGSLDVMSVLKNGGDGYDAVWPASSMWITMGDSKHVVKNEKSTSTTPVVFGVKKSKAVELGWADASGKTKPVSTADVAQAVRDKKLSFAMTSATQSNSGASAYFAFLSAFSGHSPITAADLADSNVKTQVKTLLSGVDRSSGSSDWLKDMITKDPDSHDAMVNYESLVVQADKQLTADGHEPLLAVYPSDGIAVSDSPLGYIDRGQGSEEEQAFRKFQEAITSDESKLGFEKIGRRAGLGGRVSDLSDSTVKSSFNPDWGVVTDASVMKTVQFPDSDVITAALTAYQSELRKPAWTVWVVDYSGSMRGEGYDGVRQGMDLALDPEKSKEAFIQPGSEDVNIFIPFSSRAGEAVKAEGADTRGLLDAVDNTDVDGGTNIYDGLSEALRNLPGDPSKYTVAIALMTDGMSDTGDEDRFREEWDASKQKPAIFPIMFGDADSTQLDALAELSNGKTFDGRTGDLASVFKTVKAYN